MLHHPRGSGHRRLSATCRSGSRRSSAIPGWGRPTAQSSNWTDSVLHNPIFLIHTRIWKQQRSRWIDVGSDSEGAAQSAVATNPLNPHPRPRSKDNQVLAQHSRKKISRVGSIRNLRLNTSWYAWGLGWKYLDPEEILTEYNLRSPVCCTYISPPICSHAQTEKIPDSPPTRPSTENVNGWAKMSPWDSPKLKRQTTQNQGWI